MLDKTVKTYAPATIANISVGFDILGVAIDEPGDFVVAKKIPEKQFIFKTDSKISNLPSTNDNVAAHVTLLMMKELAIDFGIEMTLHKKMPLGSGMGSSGASSVAAVVAVNALLDKPLDKKLLIPFAMEGERKASGSAHVDNVAPSLLGGGCIILQDHPLDIVQFHIHPDITWVIVSPSHSIITSQARALLPNNMPLHLVTRQMSNFSGFILGLMNGDAALVSRCATDYIAEPSRHQLIPGFNQVKQAALQTGALACGISGSGPAMFAITLSRDKATEVANSMVTAFEKNNLQAVSYISSTNQKGAYVVEDVA